MRPRVHADKHILQQSVFAVASGAIANQVIATGVDIVAAQQQVRQGSTISAVYIEMWLTSDDATQGSAIVTLELVPGSTTTLMTAAESASLNTYDNKKNVLHTFQGLLGPNVQPAQMAVRGWFKIPKGKQRFGLNDRLVLNIHGQSNGLTGCGFFLYKEQY